MENKVFLYENPRSFEDGFSSTLSQQSALIQAHSYQRYSQQHSTPDKLRSLYESARTTGRTKVILPQPHRSQEFVAAPELLSLYRTALQPQHFVSFPNLPQRQVLTLAPPEVKVEQKNLRLHACNIYDLLVQKHRHFTRTRSHNLSTHRNSGGIFQTNPVKPVRFSPDLIRKCNIQGLLEVFLDFDLIEDFVPKDRIPELLDANTALKKPKKKMKSFVQGDRSRSETGYFGVRLSTSGYRFRATVNYLGKSYNAGTFLTVEEAAEKYDEKLLELSKGKMSSCRLNCPQLWTPEKTEKRTEQSFAGDKHLQKRSLSPMLSGRSFPVSRKRTFDEMNEPVTGAEPLNLRKLNFSQLKCFERQ